MLLQVLRLTQEQISQLPPAERDAILALVSLSPETCNSDRPTLLAIPTWQSSLMKDVSSGMHIRTSHKVVLFHHTRVSVSWHYRYDRTTPPPPPPITSISTSRILAIIYFHQMKHFTLATCSAGSCPFST